MKLDSLSQSAFRHSDPYRPNKTGRFISHLLSKLDSAPTHAPVAPSLSLPRDAPPLRPICLTKFQDSEEKKKEKESKRLYWIFWHVFRGTTPHFKQIGHFYSSSLRVPSCSSSDSSDYGNPNQSYNVLAMLSFHRKARDHLRDQRMSRLFLNDKARNGHHKQLRQVQIQHLFPL